MALETLKESITAYPAATFFTVVVVGFILCYVVSNLFGSSDDGHHVQRLPRSKKQMEPLPLPVQRGEISSEEYKRLLKMINEESRTYYGPGELYPFLSGKDASRAYAKMSFKDKYLNGDLNGLSEFVLKSLQRWEDKLMGKHVIVGTVKTTVHVTDDGPSQGQAEEASQSDAAKPANAEVAKPAEDGPSETAAPKETEENDVETKE